MAWKFGHNARLWLIHYGLTNEQVDAVEQAVEQDNMLARFSRPPKMPSMAQLMRRQARQLERKSKKMATG